MLRFGVEIEAGWDSYIKQLEKELFRLKYLYSETEKTLALVNSENYTLLRYTNEVKSDGSLKANTDCYLREVTTKIFQYSKDLEVFKKYLEKLNDYLREVNESMGFHVHFSFSDFSNYILLLDRKFVISLKKFLKKEFSNDKKLLDRFRNQYCKEIIRVSDFFKYKKYRWSRC